MNFIRNRDRKHNLVGTILQSDFLGSQIIITKYTNDTNWYFKKYHAESNTVYGKEMRAGSAFSYFVENGKVIKYAN